MKMARHAPGAGVRKPSRTRDVAPRDGNMNFDRDPSDCARARDIDRHARKRGPSVGDRVMKLAKDQAIGGEVGVLDGAVVEAFKRLAQDVVGLA